jgi:hypothetical protein
MQCRRRWSAIAVVILMGAGTSLVLARDPFDDAKAMEAAKGTDAVILRAAILADLNKMNVTDKDDYVSKKMLGTDRNPGPFVALLASSSPDAQLNAAITIAQTKTLSADAALESMLKHSNPAIRYWGAKGLTDIMDEIAKIPSSKTRAINTLTDALSKETSGVVKQQIIRALIAADDAPAVITATQILADQLQKGISDHETLDAAAAALNQIDTLIKGGTTVDVPSTAQAAAFTASFAAQQLVALKAQLPEGVTDVPEDMRSSTANVANKAINVLNDLAGKSPFTPVARTASPEEIQFATDSITGSSSAPGDLQKMIPGVPIPPAIKKQP